MSIKTKSILLIILLLLIDQASKIYIKLNFALGDEVEVFPWFKILFIENNGMAFGMELVGKLFLTLFRITAVVFLSYFISKLIRQNARQDIYWLFPCSQPELPAISSIRYSTASFSTKVLPIRLLPSFPKGRLCLPLLWQSS